MSESATPPSEQVAPAPEGQPWTEIRAAKGLLRGLSLREIIAYRFVALALARRAIKARHKQTAVGVLWLVLLPLATVVVFSLVFGRLAGLASEGAPYPVFVLSGLVVWHYFAAVLNAAALSLVQQQELLTKLYFPRVLAPVAAALPPLIDLGVELLVLAGFMAAYGRAPGPQILTLPLWIAALCVIVSGLGLLFAALNVQFRDVGYGLPFLLQLWLFASPVVYATSSVHGLARVVLSLNPVTGIIDGFRWAVIDSPAPRSNDLLSLAVGLVLVVGSLLYFQRVERRLADVV
jgi:lipopolysaccharide transport system permease protein